MTLKNYWRKFRKAINGLELRERQLITLTCTFLLVMAFVVFAWQPLYVSWEKSNQSITSNINSVNNIKNNIKEIKSASTRDVNKSSREQVKLLSEELEKLQNEIENITASLISPKNMNQVFSTLLQNSELSINKVTNSEAEAINIKNGEASDNLLYKHGLSLEMAGTFKNSLKYLQRVEKQKWHLYWDELKFKTSKYPQGVFTINVHTLSTSDHVLGL